MLAARTASWTATTRYRFLTLEQAIPLADALDAYRTTCVAGPRFPGGDEIEIPTAANGEELLRRASAPTSLTLRVTIMASPILAAGSWARSYLPHRGTLGTALFVHLEASSCYDSKPRWFSLCDICF